MYHELEGPYEFLYRLQPALAPGARVGIIDMERPTQRHGAPPALLGNELAALGYRQLDFALLVPADGYLAVFTQRLMRGRSESGGVTWSSRCKKTRAALCS